MTEEKTYQISPIVTESIAHNTKVIPRHDALLNPAGEPFANGPQTLSNLQGITASLFGITAGILGLESYLGFLFYLLLSAVTVLLFHTLRVAPDARAAGLGSFDTSRYFRTAFSFWGSGFMAGLPGFVLTWTLFYNLVRP